ncbi:MAG: TetR/AcrR family transcriptional regulator [Hyphomonadaceae bacterium]|nr:TetR/AcrR family transcriptional regulator [Hyphomonadaceae bacterium]
MVTHRWARHPDPKAAMIEAATTLFRRRGYEGVGVAELIAFSGAPRGSLYFHFPGGKEQIALEAVRGASEAVLAGIRERAKITTSLEDYINTACTGWAANLDESGFENGCIIALVGLEAASVSPALKAEAAKAFADWEDALSAMANEKGLPEPWSRQFASAFIGAVEGGIMLARTRNRSRAMLDAAAACTAYVKALRAEAEAAAQSRPTVAEPA